MTTHSTPSMAQRGGALPDRLRDPLQRLRQALEQGSAQLIGPPGSGKGRLVAAVRSQRLASDDGVPQAPELRLQGVLYAQTVSITIARRVLEVAEAAGTLDHPDSLEIAEQCLAFGPDVHARCEMAAVLAQREGLRVVLEDFEANLDSHFEGSPLAFLVSELASAGVLLLVSDTLAPGLELPVVELGAPSDLGPEHASGADAFLAELTEREGAPEQLRILVVACSVFEIPMPREALLAVLEAAELAGPEVDGALDWLRDAGALRATHEGELMLWSWLARALRPKVPAAVQHRAGHCFHEHPDAGGAIADTQRAATHWLRAGDEGGAIRVTTSIAQLLARGGAAPEAHLSLRRLRRQLRDPAYVLGTDYERARLFEEAEEFENALELLEALDLRLASGEDEALDDDWLRNFIPHVRFRLGHCLAAVGDFPAAAESFAAVIEAGRAEAIGPGLFAAGLRRLALLRSGDPEADDDVALWQELVDLMRAQLRHSEPPEAHFVAIDLGGAWAGLGVSLLQRNAQKQRRRQAFDAARSALFGVLRTARAIRDDDELAEELIGRARSELDYALGELASWHGRAEHLERAIAVLEERTKIFAGKDDVSCYWRGRRLLDLAEFQWDHDFLEEGLETTERALAALDAPEVGVGVSALEMERQRAKSLERRARFLWELEAGREAFAVFADCDARYRSMLEALPGDWHLLHDRAWLHNKIALYRHADGEHTLGHQAREVSLELLWEMSELFPDDLHVRSDLAHIEQRIARQHVKCGEIEAAVAHFGRAMAVLDPLLDSASSTPDASNSLSLLVAWADNVAELSELLHDEDLRAEGLALADARLETLAALFEAHPHSRGLRMSYASLLRNSCSYAGDDIEPEVLVSRLEQSVELLEPLCGEDSDDTEALYDKAERLYQLARALGISTRGAALAGEAREICDRLIRDDAEDPDPTVLALACITWLVEMHQAEEFWDDAVDLASAGIQRARAWLRKHGDSFPVQCRLAWLLSAQAVNYEALGRPEREMIVAQALPLLRRLNLQEGADGELLTLLQDFFLVDQGLHDGDAETGSPAALQRVQVHLDHLESLAQAPKPPFGIGPVLANTLVERANLHGARLESTGEPEALEAMRRDYEAAIEVALAVLPTQGNESTALIYAATACQGLVTVAEHDEDPGARERHLLRCLDLHREAWALDRGDAHAAAGLALMLASVASDSLAEAEEESSSAERRRLVSRAQKLIQEATPLNAGIDSAWPEYPLGLQANRELRMARVTDALRREDLPGAIGQQREVIGYWRRELALTPHDAELQIGLAGALRDLGHLLEDRRATEPLDEALAINRRILALDPSDAEARLELAYTLSERFETLELERDGREALRLLQRLDKEGALDDEDRDFMADLSDELLD